MFAIGDTVLYGHSGVCRITDIRTERFGPSPRTYYVLAPVHDRASTIYCPVDQEKLPLRPLLNADEVRRLIHAIPQAQDVWIEDNGKRRDRFADMLKSGDREQMVALIRTIYQHRCQRDEAGKKLHLADERVLRDAERLLYEEFAEVLGLRPDEVVDYIREELQEGA